MKLQPIGTLELQQRFRSTTGRIGTLVNLSPSSATVIYDAAPRVRAFKDRWGQERTITVKREKPTAIALSAMVELIP